MSDEKRKISELPSNDSPSTSTTLVGVDNGETVQIPITEFVTKDENGNVKIRNGAKVTFYNKDESDYCVLECEEDGTLSLNGNTVATLDDIPSGDGTSSGSSNSMPYISFGCYSPEFTVADLMRELPSEVISSGQPAIVSFVGMLSGTFLCRFNNYHSDYYGCEFTDLTNLKACYFEGTSSSLSLYDNLSNGASSGGGSAINLDHSIPVTYAELRDLRDNGSLVPGMFYRITDYECSTRQEGTRAMNHRFDIIVQALSNCDLSEDAKADFNEDDGYFRDLDANLGGWELKYCLDNDYTRFAWATQVIYTDTSHENPMVRLPRFDWCYESAYSDGFGYAWGYLESDENTDPETLFYSGASSVTDGELLWHDRNVYPIEVDPFGIGKGVIYYMKDEHGNECHYDFKNIQFKRSAEWQEEDAQFIENELCTPVGEVEWFYTFSWVTEDLVVLDTTVNQWIPGDDAYPYGTRNNKIGDYYNAAFQGRSLNNTVFVSCARYDSIFYGYNRNVFGEGCDNNTFFNDCSYNSIGDNSWGNIMSNFGQNNIDSELVGNRFIRFWGNKIARGFCWNNGSYFENNTVEQNCSSNSFLDSISQSYIGSEVYGNEVEYMGNCKVDNYIQNKRISNCAGSYDENWNLIPARVTNNNYHEATVENKE